MRRIQIVDTTLRDGLQAPGIDLTQAEKIELALRLDRIGVDELEIGTPAMGRTACDDIRAIADLGLSARLSVWCRAHPDDLTAAAESGVNGVHISFPVSDILLNAFDKDAAWLYRALSDILPGACRQFESVSVGAQDATRTDMKHLVRFARAAAAFGINRMRLADTVGICRPGRIDRMIRILKSHAPHMSFEFHAHNDLGMATANAVAAAEAGAEAISVTVNGLGERAGNAPLEEVVMAISAIDEMECAVKTEALMDLCARVAEMTGRSIPVSKPVTGSAAFSHESGIHCAALLKSPLAYQPFLPEAVGRSDSQMVIGTHSGCAAIRSALAKHQIKMSQDLAPAFLERVRAWARAQKKPVAETDLRRLHNEFLNTCRRPASTDNL